MRKKASKRTAEGASIDARKAVAVDAINPAHYRRFGAVEVIDITKHLNFCRGNAVKYLCRAGFKDSADEIEDLQKAAFYINAEIERLSSC